jgi:hypothetical protein
MKTLHLKSKVKLSVILSQEETPQGKKQDIAVYYNYNPSEVVFTISKRSWCGIECELPEGKNTLHWDEIDYISEITNNFHQYFDNLNQ